MGVWRYEGGLFDEAGDPASWPELVLFGHPVAHSRSPLLHEAALRSERRGGHYRVVDVRPDGLTAALVDALEGGVRGVNLTIPHKSRALDGLERVSQEAEEIGAANTLVRSDGRDAGSSWVAHNTDSRGLAMALERMLGRDLGGVLGHVAVLGSGGAARAAVHCVRSLGARRVRVASRSRERAQWALDQGVEWVELEELHLEGVRLLLQCTSLGLEADDPAPVGLESAESDLAVFDMVYGERPSMLLSEAIARGLRAEDGASMLVAQAALSYSMWFGGIPPVTVMAEAMGIDWERPRRSTSPATD